MLHLPASVGFLPTCGLSCVQTPLVGVKKKKLGQSAHQLTLVGINILRLVLKLNMLDFFILSLKNKRAHQSAGMEQLAKTYRTYPNKPRDFEDQPQESSCSCWDPSQDRYKNLSISK